MSAFTAQGQAERAELDAILRSGIFDRAPNLASFLRYVCERHFEGDSDAIKEYSIAVEALGRTAEFDQKKDSIVRVEAHRLRKRLAEFYATQGGTHPIQIEIPNGQYAPRFIYKPISESNTPAKPASFVFEPRAAEIASPPPVNGHTAVAKSGFIPYGAWIGMAILSIATVTAIVSMRRHPAPAVPLREVWKGSFSEPVPSEFRFIAGYHGSPFTDRQGRTWQPDAYFDGGISTAIPTDRFYEGLPDPALARSQREGNFSYAIPVRQGTYEVHLYFIETQPGDPTDPSNARAFRIYLNDKIAFDLFDPRSEAGAPNRLHSRVFRDVTPEKDGRIHLKFENQLRAPLLTAAEILSSRPGSVRPVRIVAAKASVTDSDGSVWDADEYGVGGMLLERKDSIQDPGLKILFTGEHYGNFSYHIPVPPGKYRVRLYFAETYFGSKLPYADNNGVIGARVFHVFADGVALLRDFDVAKTAGGPNRAVIKTFENIEPNAQGQILLEFVPVQNYAEVNAIEVTQMN